jgi:putative transposase
VPYQVKKIAVKDAYQAFSNGCKKAKKTGEPFKLRFRSRRNPKQSCFIQIQP